MTITIQGFLANDCRRLKQPSPHSGPGFDPNTNGSARVSIGAAHSTPLVFPKCDRGYVSPMSFLSHAACSAARLSKDPRHKPTPGALQQPAELLWQHSLIRLDYPIGNRWATNC